MGDRKKPLVANRESRVECRCQGSRPTPVFRWFVGDRELDVVGPGKMTIEHHQATSSTGKIVEFLAKGQNILFCFINKVCKHRQVEIFERLGK